MPPEWGSLQGLTPLEPRWVLEETSLHLGISDNSPKSNLMAGLIKHVRENFCSSIQSSKCPDVCGVTPVRSRGEEAEVCRERKPSHRDAGPAPLKGKGERRSRGRDLTERYSLEKVFTGPQDARHKDRLQKFILGRNDQTILPSCFGALVWGCLRRTWLQRKGCAGAVS